MTNKAFSILLLFTLVFGGALGAAFAAGVALGKNQGPDPSQEASSFGTPRSSQGGFPGGGFSRDSGEAQSAPNSGAPGGSSGESSDSLGIIGTVDNVQNDLVTLNTFSGPVKVTLAEETTIRNTGEGTVADLVEGANIRIIGRRDEEGNLSARAVTLLLEGSGEDPIAAVTDGGRRGGFGGGPPVTGTIDSVDEGRLIISGPDGQVTVTLQADTIIQKTTVGTVADLVDGARVRVSAQTGEAGNMIAQSLTVAAGDADGFFGRRGDRRGQ